MIVSREQYESAELKIKNLIINRLNSFKYFRNVLDDKCDNDEGINTNCFAEDEMDMVSEFYNYTSECI